MKARGFRLAGLAAALAWGAAAQDVVPIDEASFEGGAVHLRWQSEPDETYRVTGRTSLLDGDGATWAPAGGYRSGAGWTLSQTVDPGTNRMMFFRVEKVDQSPPVFSFLSPAKDALSVAPDAVVRVAVSDATGVAADGSLAVYVGEERHALGEDPAVRWEDGVLSYEGGGLGAPGETVELWATATDLRGNTGASASSMVTLASEPEPVEDAGIMVIGRGRADTASVAKNGPAAAARRPGEEGTVWIADSTDGTLVFGYTGAVPLAAGQLWASGDPNRIFYRRILSWEETEPGILTAFTESVTLADFFDGGSFSSEDGDWTEWDAEESAATAARVAASPRIGGSASRSFRTNGVIPAFAFPSNVPIAFRGAIGSWDVSAGFSVAADFAVLKRKFRSCDLAVDGKVHVRLDPVLAATSEAAYAGTFEKTLAKATRTFGGTIGPVPVWVDLSVEVPAEIRVEAQATNANVSAVVDISRGLDWHWRLDGDAWSQVGSGNTGWVVAETNFSYDVSGSAGVRVSLRPTVTVKVYSLVGAYGWVEPYLECNASGEAHGRNETILAPDFHYLVSAYAGLDAGIGLASTIWSADWGEPPGRTFSPLRKQLLWLEGSNTPPVIVSAPAGCVAESGEAVMLAVEAEGTWPLRYAWYHNGTDTGRRESFLTIPAGDATAGRYTVEVRNAWGTASASADVAVVTNVPVAGFWRFVYEWEGQAACCYGARLYADGSMHDTSPSDYWWDWHLNGATVRFETRAKWEGTSAVYRGTRKSGTYMSGTMLSPAGMPGTWSLELLDPDPDAPVSLLRERAAARGTQAAGAAVSRDPAGFPLP